MRFRLCESIEYDSEGNPLSEEQVRFFKDSKVRDSQGRLLVCYHGTDANFSIFDYNKIGGDGKAGYGFYFTLGTKLQFEYDYPKACYINLKNPMYNTDDRYDELLRFQDDLYGIKTQKEIIDLTINKFKVDGIIDRNRGCIVAYYPNQIKSITNKNPSSSDNINEEILYRTEDAYGSGVRDLEKVIRFEIDDLGNTDIIYTLLDTFKTTKDQRRKLNYFLDNGDPDMVDEIVSICLEIIRGKYPTAKYALWLATKDAVESIYGGDETNIDSYETEYNIPISDLGYDGKLFVFSKKPQPK